MDRQISLKIDTDVLNEVRAVARAQGNRSPASVIREVLAKEFKAEAGRDAGK